VRHGNWRARPRGRVLTLEARAEARIRATIARALEGADDPRWISHADLADVLAAVGIDLVPSELTALDSVEATAERLGYPLVAKAVAPGLLHKSDIGGVLVEVLNDAAFRLSPVTDLDAEEMLASLRSTRILDGYRGALPGDRAALVSVLMRVSALVEVVPEILELDLNPVKVLEPGKGAVVLDARMRVGLPQPTGD
jgi:acyl-CoA synthetase (NDP forming)